MSRARPDGGGRLTLPTPLVATNWPAEHLGDPDLRVLDATAHPASITLTRELLGRPQSAKAAGAGLSCTPRRRQC